MSGSNSILPKYTTPKELASHLGMSERALREFTTVRRIGRTIGRMLIYLEEDVALIMEASKCPSFLRNAETRGTTAAPLPEGDYAVLVERRTKKRAADRGGS